MWKGSWAGGGRAERLTHVRGVLAEEKTVKNGSRSQWRKKTKTSERSCGTRWGL